VLEAQGYKRAGVNEMSATGSLPEGLSGSGKAIREYYDIGSRRLKEVSQNYENSIVELINIMLDMVESIIDEDDSYPIKCMSDKDFEVIDWKKIKIDKDNRIIKLYPTNFLPSTPPGKWAVMQEMLAAGFIDRESGLEMMEYPDIQSVTDRINAPYKIILLDIDKILEDGEPVVPKPYYDLTMAPRLALLSLLKAEKDGYEPERLDMLRDYIETLELFREQERQERMMELQEKQMEQQQNQQRLNNELGTAMQTGQTEQGG
jgi:hypothetical protein